MRVIVTFLTLTLAASAQTAPRTASGNPATAAKRSVEERIGDRGVDLKDFGARCDGVTDDTAAIQAAFNAAPSNGAISVSGLCAISDTVYIPATKFGIHIEATSPGTNDKVSTNVGLIAKTGAHPFQMLKVYGRFTYIHNLYVNCNGVALNAFVLVDSLGGTYENNRAGNCVSASQPSPAGDGWVLSNTESPATALTRAVEIGASTLSVANSAVEGYPLSGLSSVNGYACGELVIDFATPNQEFLFFNVKENELTLTSRTTHPHAAGATVRCNGNNDRIDLLFDAAYNNAGWGLDMLESTDNNGIHSYGFDSESNKLGGEIWSGSVNVHIGGNSQGNTGPALQLGDLNGGGANGTNGRSTAQNVIDAFLDLENSAPYNAVFSICDFRSSVTFKQPSELAFNVGGPYCHSDPAGNTTLGSGPGSDANGTPGFTVKTSSGSVVSQPAKGIAFYDAKGVLQSTFGPLDTDVSGKMTLKGLSGSGSRPACVDAAGNIYAGKNVGGVLSCP